MSCPVGRETQDGPHAGTEAAATATAIAGLRRRLRRLGTLEHPAIGRELGKLEEQLAALSEHAGRKPGRHRAQPGTHHDPAEPGLTPDSSAARTPAGYLAAL